MAEFLTIRLSPLMYLIVSQGSIARKPGEAGPVTVFPGTNLLG